MRNALGGETRKPLSGEGKVTRKEGNRKQVQRFRRQVICEKKRAEENPRKGKKSCNQKRQEEVDEGKKSRSGNVASIYVIYRRFRVLFGLVSARFQSVSTAALILPYAANVSLVCFSLRVPFHSLFLRGSRGQFFKLCFLRGVVGE